MDEPQVPLLCHRCGRPLEPGAFYIIRIEAVADPSPPHITTEELQGNIRGEIERLIDQMRDSSERELADQVYRRLTLHLCNACYGPWFEDPTR